ncbi:MAG: cyanophycin synthetase [Pirellulaceae bacterium]
MEIRKILVLRGPNIWARFPVLEAWVDLGPLKDSPSDELPGFTERLMNWLPTMVEHRCSPGTRGGFFERLRRGTYLAHVLEHVTLELQQLCGVSVGFGRTRETDDEGVYKVAIRYREETLGLACLREARELCLAAVFDRPYNIAANVLRLRALADEVCLGPSTAAIVDAAETRGIPTLRLNDESLVQLGYGVRQRRIRTAESDRTSAIAESIASDKSLAKRLLTQAGIPVPVGRRVTNVDDAWEAACEIGLPVVVKPCDGNHGRAVAMNLSRRRQIEAAYKCAWRQSAEKAVLIEQFITGFEHRLLIVGNHLVAATAGEYAYVIGDGEHTIAELIELQLNNDPRRGDDRGTPLAKIALDPDLLLALDQEGYVPQSCPPQGRRVLIQRNGNLSTDVTDRVHPAVAAQAVEAARVIGLDIAGLDIVAQDISRPLEEQSGAVVEINASPGLQAHLQPACGTPRAVGAAIIDYLFPSGGNGRIPLVAVTGTNGKTTVTRLVAHLLHGAGHVVGQATSDGIEIGDRCIARGDCAGPASARAILAHPRVTAAVCEVGRGGILREGIGFDKCEVAIVTNIRHADHVGQYWIQTAEHMSRVKQAIVDAVLPTGTAVLNAEDPLVVRMSASTPASVLLFAKQSDHPVLVEHRNRGGKTVFVDRGRILFAEGNRRQELLALDHVPMSHKGRAGFQVENILAATAAAWCLGLSPVTIRAGLESFRTDTTGTPARFNVLEVAGRTVFVDHARNASALEAITDALDGWTSPRRTIAYSVARDQREDELIRQGKCLASEFDSVVLYSAAAVVSDAWSTTTRLLRAQFVAGCRATQVVEAPSLAAAVSHAYGLSQPNELLVIQVDEVTDGVRLVHERLGLGAPEAGNPSSRTEQCQPRSRVCAPSRLVHDATWSHG